MLNKTSRGKILLDLEHVNRKELLKLGYIENLGTR